jgi:ABC-2 type transport system ATP-binding protein
MRIEVRNLTKKYGKIVALDGVNLQIEHGMYGLLGPNGAGKTTLMRIMATTLQPTEGTVLYDDYDVTKHQHEIRKIIGYLPQDFRAFEGVRVRDFLEYVAILKQLKPKSIKAAIADVLDITNLGDRAEAKIHELSGGMKQRLGIAQAFLGDPKVIIVDEPTAGLDPEERTRFRNLLAEISMGKAVILSTHIVSDIEDSCYRLSVLDHGKIVYSGGLQGLIDVSIGRVWEKTLSQAEYEEFRARYAVLTMKVSETGVTVRFIAAEEVPGAVAVAPTLEYGYMCKISQIGKGTRQDAHRPAASM